MTEQYSIADRFIVEPAKDRGWYVKDKQGKLHQIFGEEPIKSMSIKAYKSDDVYWILHVKLESSEKSEGYVAIKGNEVVSYSVFKGDEFYIRHYGKEFLGKIKVDRRKDILIDGNYLEVRKGEKDTVSLWYEFLGEKLTPMISVGRVRCKVACFPEFGRVYRCWDLHLENCWGCLNVWVLKYKKSYLYLLLENGEEFLVYEGSMSEIPIKFGLPEWYILPTFHKLVDIMVVDLKYGVGDLIVKFVKDFRRIPGVEYLYVKKDLERDVYISFNLKNWKKVGEVGKIVFKGRKLGFQRYGFEAALEKFAKRLPVNQELLSTPTF